MLKVFLGYLAAQNNLGIMYQNGDEVLRDDEEAVKWYRKAGAQGNKQALYTIGLANAEAYLPPNFMPRQPWNVPLLCMTS